MNSKTKIIQSEKQKEKEEDWIKYDRPMGYNHSQSYQHMNNGSPIRRLFFRLYNFYWFVFEFTGSSLKLLYFSTPDSNPIDCDVNMHTVTTRATTRATTKK